MGEGANKIQRAKITIHHQLKFARRKGDRPILRNSFELGKGALHLEGATLAIF